MSAHERVDGVEGRLERQDAMQDARWEEMCVAMMALQETVRQQGLELERHRRHEHGRQRRDLEFQQLGVTLRVHEDMDREMVMHIDPRGYRDKEACVWAIDKIVMPMVGRMALPTVERVKERMDDLYVQHGLEGRLLRLFHLNPRIRLLRTDDLLDRLELLNFLARLEHMDPVVRRDFVDLRNSYILTLLRHYGGVSELVRASENWRDLDEGVINWDLVIITASSDRGISDALDEIRMRIQQLRYEEQMRQFEEQMRQQIPHHHRDR